MTVHVHCPRCGCDFQRPDSCLNSTLPCPDCGQGLRVGGKVPEPLGQPEGWKFDDLVKDGMNLLERYVLYRREINAVRASLQPGNQELVWEVLHGYGGVLDTSDKHVPDTEKPTLLAEMPLRIVFAVGRLANVIEYRDLAHIKWEGEELHLAFRDDEGLAAKLDASGIWVRPSGRWPVLRKTALQLRIRERMQGLEGPSDATPLTRQADHRPNEATSPPESPAPFDEAAFLRRMNEKGEAQQNAFAKSVADAIRQGTWSLPETAPVTVLRSADEIEAFFRSRGRWAFLRTDIMKALSQRLARQPEMLPRFVRVCERYGLLNGNFLPICDDGDDTEFTLSNFSYTLYRRGSGLLRVCVMLAEEEHQDAMRQLLVDIRDALESSIAISRFSPCEHYALATAWLWAGNCEKAIEACDHGIKNLKDLQATPVTDLSSIDRATLEMLEMMPETEQVLEELRTELHRGGSAECVLAIHTCRMAVREEPSNVDVHHALGLAYAESGRHTEAIDVYRAALKLAPGNSEICLDLAAAYKQTGQGAEAIEVLRDCLVLQPTNAEVHVRLAVSLVDSDRSPEAIEACQEAIRLKPDHSSAHAVLGGALRRAKRLPEAVVALRKALDLQPEWPAVLAELGVTLGLQGHHAEAANAFEQVVRLRPNDASAYHDLGMSYGGMGRYAEAADAFKKSIELGPEQADAYCGLGTALFDMGNHDAAVQAYKTAIRLKPQDAQAYLGLGMTFYQMDRVAEAIEAWQAAIRIKPDFTAAYAKLCLAHYLAGDLAGAARMYETIKRLDPDLAACLRADANFPFS
jgi:tetratricopeptide (TPR) repeat protein